MTLHLNLNTHYRCSFRLKLREEGDADWSDVVRTIRSWIARTPGYRRPAMNDAFNGSWIYRSGEWSPAGKPHRIETAATELADGEDTSVPEAWALRYEHPCNEDGRWWRFDCGILQVEEGREDEFDVSLHLSHFIQPGFVGAKPVAPLPTAPRIVSRIIDAANWSCVAGSERVTSEVQLLEVGEGETLRRRLENADRRCPIILVSRHYPDGEPGIDAVRLARLVAGSAVVLQSASSEVDKELEYCLGRRLSCWNGMTRIYQPGLSFDSTGDERRHRFFTAEHVERVGEDDVIEMIVESVGRRPIGALATRVSTVEDVATYERDKQLAALRAGTTNDVNAYIELLEATNSEIEGQFNALKDAVHKGRQTIADQGDELAARQLEIQEARRQIAELSGELRYARAHAKAADALQSLPQNVRQVVEVVAELYNDRLVFTDRALASCKDVKIKHEIVWSALCAMANHLHPAFYGVDQSSDIEQAFRELSTFRLAMTERKMTKDDSKLMRDRRDSYEGVEVEAVPHVKLDKATTRIYFAPLKHKQQDLLVVSFIGHLNTAGTRKRS